METIQIFLKGGVLPAKFIKRDTIFCLLTTSSTVLKCQTQISTSLTVFNSLLHCTGFSLHIKTFFSLQFSAHTPSKTSSPLLVFLRKKNLFLQNRCISRFSVATGSRPHAPSWLLTSFPPKFPMTHVDRCNVERCFPRKCSEVLRDLVWLRT